MSNSYLYAAMMGGLLLACASTGSTKKSSERLASDYAPLKVGARWNYEVEYPGQKGEMMVELISFKDGHFVDNRKGTLQHTRNGLRDRDRYLIRHPIKAGNSWKSVVGPSAVEHLSIAEVGVPCESRAGRFADCLVVVGRLRRDKNMQLHIKWVWAKGVGLVKLETESEITGKGRERQVVHSLKDYSFGGDVKAKSSSDDDGPDTWTTK